VLRKPAPKTGATVAKSLPAFAMQAEEFPALTWTGVHVPSSAPHIESDADERLAGQVRGLESWVLAQEGAGAMPLCLLECCRRYDDLTVRQARLTEAMVDSSRRVTFHDDHIARIQRKLEHLESDRRYNVSDGRQARNVPGDVEFRKVSFASVEEVVHISPRPEARMVLPEASVSPEGPSEPDAADTLRGIGAFLESTTLSLNVPAQLPATLRSPSSPKSAAGPLCSVRAGGDRGKLTTTEAHARDLPNDLECLDRESNTISDHVIRLEERSRDLPSEIDLLELQSKTLSNHLKRLEEQFEESAMDHRLGEHLLEVEQRIGDRLADVFASIAGRLDDQLVDVEQSLTSRVQNVESFLKNLAARPTDRTCRTMVETGADASADVFADPSRVPEVTAQVDAAPEIAKLGLAAALKTTSERVTSLEQRMKGMLKASEVEHLVKRLQAVEETNEARVRLESEDGAEKLGEGREHSRLSSVEVRITALMGLTKKEREMSESLCSSVDALAKHVEAHAKELELCRDALRFLTGIYSTSGTEMPDCREPTDAAWHDGGLRGFLEDMSRRLEQCSDDIIRIESAAALGMESKVSRLECTDSCGGGNAILEAPGLTVTSASLDRITVSFSPAAPPYQISGAFLSDASLHDMAVSGEVKCC